MKQIRVLARKSKRNRRVWVFPVMLRQDDGTWAQIYQADFLKVRDHLNRYYLDAEIEFEHVDF